MNNKLTTKLPEQTDEKLCTVCLGALSQLDQRIAKLEGMSSPQAPFFCLRTLWSRLNTVVSSYWVLAVVWTVFVAANFYINVRDPEAFNKVNNVVMGVVLGVNAYAVGRSLSQSIKENYKSQLAKVIFCLALLMVLTQFLPFFYDLLFDELLKLGFSLPS